MGTGLITLALALATVMATVAYRHPGPYARLLPFITGLFALSDVLMMAFNAGAWATQSAAQTVDLTDLHAYSKIHEATQGIGVPWWGFLVAGGGMAYAGLLALLPKLGIVAKDE